MWSSLLQCLTVFYRQINSGLIALDQTVQHGKRANERILSKVKSAMILTMLMVGIIMMMMMKVMNLTTWMMLWMIIMILMIIILSLTSSNLKVCVLQFNLI